MSSQNHGQPISSPEQGEGNLSPESAAEPSAQPDDGLANSEHPPEQNPEQALEPTAESTPVASNGSPKPGGGNASQAKADEGSEQPLPPSPGESVEERVLKLERRQEEAVEDAEQPLPPSSGISLEERVSKLEQWQETMDQQLKQQQQQLKEKEDQIMRNAAEFDNFRRRSERDYDKLKLRYTCDVLREMLPIVDNFERARKALPGRLGELNAQDVYQDYQGIYKQLVKVLRNLNISSMKVEGQVFDPSLHQAVMREPSQEYGEDVVMEELQRGYHLDGEVLRHAMVKVSMGPGPDDRQPVNPEPMTN